MSSVGVPNTPFATALWLLDPIQVRPGFRIAAPIVPIVLTRLRWTGERVHAPNGANACTDYRDPVERDVQGSLEIGRLTQCQVGIATARGIMECAVCCSVHGTVRYSKIELKRIVCLFYGCCGSPDRSR